MGYNMNSSDNQPMLDDDQNGTDIRSLKKHLNQIGYVPQTNQPQQQIQLQQQRQKLLQQQRLDEELLQQRKLQQQIKQHKLKHKNKKKARQPDISHLVSDINKSLEDYSPSNSDPPKPLPQDDPPPPIKTTYLTQFLKEPILLILLYLIISQNFFKSLVGKYIKYAKPNPENCSISFLGLIIYGTIFTILFILTRKLIT
ncbi:MAG: hypothetical protein Hyperionvirus20_16 [Hyperionvirus sp.]|uniref:Uncharacterized protein n=1 Tax=Hyperionvirus sp. TaxID=2487770 RepID=A0A3G5AAG4_9VIRU|nr:MAG: hypothetical protein Hyperionvirus20_16 [Hyperionvirus sp.]